MNRRFIIPVLLFVSLAFIAACASAASDDWVFLGEATARKGADRDEIRVGAREGQFSKIQFRVRESGVEIKDAKVHYVNGSVEDVEVRAFIAAGGETRVIDLKGSDRSIEKVVFWYNTPRRAKGQAVVRLFGLR